MSNNERVSKAALLAQVQQGFDGLQAWLAALSPAQLTERTDAAGWSVKDHVMHLAMWEKGVVGLFNGEVRYEAMGLDKDAWTSGDFDRMNARLREGYKAMTLDEVLQAFRETHTTLVGQVERLSDDALNQPYRDYQPESTSETPIYQTVMSDTFKHYDEHRPWIEAIVRGE
jgi:uncharacterized protein (TIGR03083 family)